MEIPNPMLILIDMKKALCLLLAPLLMSALMVPAIANPLEGIKGKKRALVLFSKSRSYAPLGKQIDVLREYRPDLSERDMIVLLVTGREDTRSAIGYTRLKRGSARELKALYKPDQSGFTMVLIGKDGEEKTRWDKTIDPEKIFATVDAMPLRKKEMATN